ncbi:MAG: aldehyde dehydrogenase family protein [Pseudomonadota bacterium]
MAMRNITLITGEETQGSILRSFDVFSPRTEEVVARCQTAEKRHVAAAMASAYAAFKIWRGFSPEKRADTLLSIADELATSSTTLAKIIHEEQGKPFVEAEGEAEFIAEEFRAAAIEGQRFADCTLPASEVDIERRVMRAPLGVIAGFPSSNYPAAIAARKIATALAAGCTIVLRAPEEAPGSAFHIADHCVRSALPAGAVCCLSGNPSDVTSEMIRDPRCAGVSFTGSGRVGRLVLGHAASAIKPSVVELGGAAPVIVCADVDVATVSSLIVSKKLENAGQNCAAPNYVLVDQSIHDCFVEELWKKYCDAAVDSEGQVRIGPLISANAVAAYHDRISEYTRHGARIRRLDAVLPESGHFVPPAIAVGIDASSAFIHEEVFSPFLPIVSVESLDEALATANASPLGLVGYGFSASERNARRMAEELEVGSIAINKTGVGDVDAPFGGLRGSGFGTEGGRYGIEEFLTWKYVSLRHLHSHS